MVLIKTEKECILAVTFQYIGIIQSYTERQIFAEHDICDNDVAELNQ